MCALYIYTKSKREKEGHAYFFNFIKNKTHIYYSCDTLKIFVPYTFKKYNTRTFVLYIIYIIS